MALLRGLLGTSGRKPSCSAVNTSDDVYPVHMLDGTEGVRKYVISWTMRFNDVLDVDKLHDALSRLLEMGDWRKLGGRLRFKADGKLEIHVPKNFTTERPAVAFSHDVLDMGIEDHPLTSRLPKPTEGLSIQPGPIEFQDLVSGADFPATIEDMMRQDAPQLSLHIVSFNNATLVVLSFPHTMMDAMGLRALLNAWSLVLAGRENEVPPVLGARTDVLWEAGDPKSENGEKQEELILEKKRLKGTSLGMFFCRYVKDTVTNPDVESRIICLPKDEFNKIRSQAQEEVAQCESYGEKEPFVSEADIMAAWAARMVVLSEPKPRPVTVMSALNARFHLQKLLKPNGVYIQNMVLGSFMFLSPEQSRGSVGQIALTHQRHLLEQSTEGQVKSFLRATRKEHEAGKEMKPFFGEADSLPIIVNNMTKAEIYKAADFSPAVLRQGEKSESRSNPLGTMAHHFFESQNPTVKKRHWFVVLGKDHDGNYWLTGHLLSRTWAKIEEEMGSRQ